MVRLTGVPAFVHVAEQRSFRAAARILGVTPAAVSKAVSRLEEHLGAALLHRTSRRVTLTPEGEVYFAHCREALDRLQAGEDELTRSAAVATGPLRVSLSFVFGRLVARHLHRLLARSPRIDLSLSFADRAVDLAAEEVDVAVRIGPLEDSSLVARKLRTPRWATVASPAYLARRGAIRSLEDLSSHACLVFNRPTGGSVDWSFRLEPDDAPVSIRVPATIAIDQGDYLVASAVAGLGVCQAFDFMVDEHVRRGELVEVLGQQAAPAPPVHALTLAGRHRVPKVKAFLEFMRDVMSATGEPS